MNASTSVRTVVPLALVTATSMLAVDLVLPAVPVLQAALGVDVERAQAVIALFFAGLAASQLLWGELLDRFGPRRCVAVGVALLGVGSAVCALAPSADVLLAMRFVQGIAAGAATVVAPVVVRATLSDADAVRGIAAIAAIEAIVPAAGPALGAALLLWTDWRGTFWVLAATSLGVLPFVLRVTPARLPGLAAPAAEPARWRDIVGNRRYLRLAGSHALCVGALLTFVASAPQLTRHALAQGPGGFVWLQLAGVASFIAVAAISGRVSQRVGAPRAVRAMAIVHVALCAALLVAALAGVATYGGVVAFWIAFCGVLAVRGPAAFTLALRLPRAQMGRATALLTLALLLAGAAGTQGVAPFMAGASLAPLAALMLAMTLVSLALVPRGAAMAPARAEAA